MHTERGGGPVHGLMPQTASCNRKLPMCVCTDGGATGRATTGRPATDTFGTSGQRGPSPDEPTDQSRSQHACGRMTDDVDAERRAAEQRRVPDHSASGSLAAQERQGPAAAEDRTAQVRLRALQPARRAAHPARPGQAVQGAVPLTALAGAAPDPGRPAARRRPAALPRPLRLADAAAALDRARPEPEERHTARPRHRDARLDRTDRAVPHDERAVQRARDAGGT